MSFDDRRAWDQFAAAALAGCVEKAYSDALLAKFGSTEAVAELIASAAAQIADAMMERRKQR